MNLCINFCINVSLLWVILLFLYRFLWKVDRLQPSGSVNSLKISKKLWFGTQDSHWGIRWQEIKNSWQDSPHDFEHKKTYITLVSQRDFLSENVSTRGMMESESQLQDLACIEIGLHVGHGSLRTECCGQNVHRENASINIPTQPWPSYTLSQLSCFWNDKYKQQTKNTPTYSQPPWNIVETFNTAFAFSNNSLEGFWHLSIFPQSPQLWRLMA